MTTTNSKIQAGTTIHFLESGLTVFLAANWSEVTHRGQQVTLTENMIFESKDRNGDSWLDLAEDPEAQVIRWGRQMFGFGPWPATESVFVRGSLSHTRERERRVAAAWQIPDEVKRGVALRLVNAEFGPLKSAQTSQTISGDSER